MRALIVEDGLSRQALAAARALAAGGWRVGIGSPERSSVAAASRSVAAWHRVAPVGDDLARFADDLGRAVAAGGYEVVFGARDDEVAALAFLRERISAVVAHPELDTVMAAQDKLELTRRGAAAGFAVPATAANVAEAGELPEGPLQVKPRVGPAIIQALELGASPPSRVDARSVRDAAELTSAIAAIESSGDEPLIQRRHVGALIAIVVLADRDHSVVSSFQQRAERTWPLDAGVSVRARIVDPDPRLAECAERLVGGLRWTGVAQLQLIEAELGEPLLIDFNGRFYGSLALAAAAGSNIAAAWADGVLSGSTPSPGPARPGTRYQWAWGDLRRATQERRGGLIRDLAGVVRYAPGAVHSVFQLRDPRPAARYLRIAGARSRRRRGEPGGGTE